MVYSGEVFEYPIYSRLLWYAAIIFGCAFVVAGIYGLLTRNFTSQSVLWIGGIFLGIGMVCGGVVELFNYQTILVKDDGISTIGPNGKIFMPWSNIDRVYYSRGEGVPAHQPYVSFYIKSKNVEIIKISQDIRNFHELGSIILERAPTGRAEYISFTELVRLYYKSYFKRPTISIGGRKS